MTKPGLQVSTLDAMAMIILFIWRGCRNIYKVNDIILDNVQFRMAGCLQADVVSDVGLRY